MRVLVVALMLVLSGFSAQAQSYSTVDLPYVQFKNAPNLPYINFQQGRPEEGGKVADTGILKAKVAFKPSQSGLVLLLHGCSGLNNQPTEYWNEGWGSLFWNAGYSVMILDSFSTRAVAESCGAADDHWSWRRRDDAYSAIEWLAKQGHTDMSNVVVLGRSNGGKTVIKIMEQKMKVVRPHLFRIGFSAYPFCKDDIRTYFYNPIHIYIGELDDANPAKWCAALRDEHHPNVDVTIYPNTFHGFDDGTHYRVDHGWREGQNPNSAAEMRKSVLAALGR